MCIIFIIHMYMTICYTVEVIHSGKIVGIFKLFKYPIQNQIISPQLTWTNFQLPHEQSKVLTAEKSRETYMLTLTMLMAEHRSDVDSVPSKITTKRWYFEFQFVVETLMMEWTFNGILRNPIKKQTDKLINTTIYWKLWEIFSPQI